MKRRVIKEDCSEEPRPHSDVFSWEKKKKNMEGKSWRCLHFINRTCFLILTMQLEISSTEFRFYMHAKPVFNPKWWIQSPRCFLKLRHLNLCFGLDLIPFFVAICCCAYLLKESVKLNNVHILWWFIWFCFMYFIIQFISIQFLFPKIYQKRKAFSISF